VETVQIFHDMENRVHSVALVHESLYRSENLARINFAEYAQALTTDILSSHESPDVPVRLQTELEPVIMSVDLAVPCGLILNELTSNAFKHGFPNGASGEIKVKRQRGNEGTCTLSVEDSGAGIPADLDVNGNKSLGIKVGTIVNPANSRCVRASQNASWNLGAFAVHGGSRCTLSIFPPPRAL
jgi:two-component sensor histidine kinase